MTCRISAWSAVLPGKVQTRIGIPVPGDREADHDLGQVGPVVLGVAVVRAEALGRTVGGRVRRVGLEVRAGRVEEEQVDLEVEQVRGRPVHLLGELGLDLQEPVHGPVALVVGELRETRDRDPLAHPGGTRQLGGGGEGPVGDHREERPLGRWVEAPAAQEAGQDLADPEPRPEAVEEPGATAGTRLEVAQLGRHRRRERLTRREGPAQRADQAPDRVGVEFVLAPEVEQDPDLRAAGRRVPLVVGQGQVPNVRAVAVAPPGGPQVHALQRTRTYLSLQRHTRADVYLCRSALWTHQAARFVLSRGRPHAFRGV